MAALLRRGSKGPDVSRLQQLLNQKLTPSPELAVDGDFGEKTLAAVRAFQLQHDLDPDGVVGPKTWGELQGLGSYLVAIRGWSVVPPSLRDFVQETMTAAYRPFNLELDFAGGKPPRDLMVEFTDKFPLWSMYGESSRPSINGDQQPGQSTIYIGVMRAMRLQLGSGGCEVMFPENREALGSLIANTAVHETAHMLGLDTGGFDDGGHVSDPDNYLWRHSAPPGHVEESTRVSPYFEYSVKQGDTLSGIVARYKMGQLDRCRFGPSDLTYQMVWGDDENKRPGFVADPKKGKAGRRANDPNSIYPGEKVALPSTNLRKQSYRQYFGGYLGPKQFSAEQTETMTAFIAARLAAGKG
jgi:hypothetical protein